MPTISLSKNGGKCEILLNGGPQSFVVDPNQVELGFNTDTNDINIYFPIQGSLFAQAFPMADVTIGAGINVGLPYHGTTPDIGSYEFIKLFKQRQAINEQW
jgi:hypothetical protein